MISLSAPLRAVENSELETARRLMNDPQLSSMTVWLFNNIMVAAKWLEHEKDTDGYEKLKRMMQHAENMTLQIKDILDYEDDHAEPSQ